LNIQVIFDVKGENLMARTYTDPVCGMELTPETAAATSEYQGQTYYFCSMEDKETFDKNPEKYVQTERGTTSR
jgi:YHS domain-containing protein